MATEDILIRYRADVSQLEGDINKVIASQEELTAATNQNTQAQNKAVNSAEFAAKKRAQLLELEVQKLKQLQAAQKLAFDPKEIQKYNDQIASTQKRVELLGGTYQKQAAQITQANQQIQNSNEKISNGINRIGAAFGVAFTAEALIQFAQQSVRAFLEAEEQANKLRFAVTSIGGEGEEALARLNAQAQQLADTTFFDDDDITAAQAALSAFGLTADQIEEIVPKLADFAAVTGGTVTEAANTLGGALEGRAGEFKRFGIEVDAASTKAENLAQVSAGLAKQAGAAGAALNTAAGQSKDFGDQVGEATEAIGEGIVTFFSEYVAVLKDTFGPLIDSITRFKNVIVDLIPDSIVNKVKEFFSSGNALKNTLELLATPARLFANYMSKIYDIIIKVIGGISGLVNVFRVGFNDIGQVVNSVGAGIADVLTGIADFDAGKIKAGLGKVKGAFSQAGADIANAFNDGYNKTLKIAEGAEKQVEKTTQAVQAANEKIFKSDELRKKSTKDLNAELEKQSKIQTNAARQNVESINKELEARKKQGEAAKKAGEDAAKAAEQFKKLIEGIDGEITKLQADLERRKIEVIPADSQKAQEDRIKALADLNEKAINDEIAGKIKLVQDDANLSEQQKNQAIAKYEELKAARLALATFNEQNELNIINAQQVKRIEDAAKQLDDLGIQQALTIEADKVEAANEAVAKSFEDLGEAITLEDFALAKDAATARTKALNQALIEENNINKTRIENARDAENAKVQAGDAAEAERKAIKIKYDNQIANADKELQNKLDKNNEDLTDNIDEQEKALLKTREDRLFQYADATAAVLSELTNLYSQFSENRIKSIEDDLQKEIEAIDLLEERNQEAFEQGIISQAELKIAQDQARQQRVNAELAAEKKIRDEKKKAAQIEKANSLFQIAIDTARNIVSQPGPFGTLIPFWAVLGAAQAAAVLAQPIPYRKGSKDTGDNPHMARVGEEGEEFVWMPSNSKVLPARQTKKYADVIDAMYDNRLDDYIYKHYITPQLIAQKQAKESQQSKNFAENMANSIVYNQSGLSKSDLEAQRRKGQYINNVDEIASAIAKQLPKYDPYRN